jgi:hypothetical protein
MRAGCLTCLSLTDSCHTVPRHDPTHHLAGVSQLVEFGVAMELWRVHVRDFVVW